MMPKPKTAVFLMGPTAAGKTALAIKLYKKHYIFKYLKQIKDRYEIYSPILHIDKYNS